MIGRTQYRRLPLRAILLITLVVALARPEALTAQAPVADGGPPLSTLLAQGGYVLVMRHARAPQQRPTAQTANPDNPDRERQLDDAGRRGATGLGEALRTMRIPIGEVLASPTYRARETVRYARLPGVRLVDELGDGGQSMQGATEAQASWLRARVAMPPASGNTVIVTHQQNLARAFPGWGDAVAEGEMVILRPLGNGEVSVVRRILIEAWPTLR